MSRRSLSLLLATLLLSVACSYRNCRNPNARLVAEAFQEIHAWSLYEPSGEALRDAAVEAMFSACKDRGDEHSEYLPPLTANLLRQQISGEFGGVGVAIGLLGDPPVLTVLEPPDPGTPAAAGDVRGGDQIVAIDGRPIAGWDIRRVQQAMRGPVGDPVALTIRREGTSGTLRIELTRAEITVPSVRGDRRDAGGAWRHLLRQDERIAMLRVAGFGDRTAAELRQLLPKLVERGARAVVLDLRGNPGGPLEAAVDVAGMFLPAGKTIVTTKGRGGRRIESFVSRGGAHLHMPLAVLLDAQSASASEIVAAAMQDHGRAVVVGQRSFGKGTVQRLAPLVPTDGILKITFASYWRPSDANIHREPGMDERDAWGVRPDPGYAVAMAAPQRQAWRAARRRRDLRLVVDPNASNAGDRLAAASAGAAGAAGAGAAGALVDPVLARAVEWLQSQLETLNPQGRAEPAA